MGAITSFFGFFLGASIMDMFGNLKNKNVMTRIFYYVSFVMSRNPNPEPEYANVSRKVMRSKEVQNAIEKSAKEELDEIRETYDETLQENVLLPKLITKHKKRATKLLECMKSSISSSLLRIAGWIMFKVLSKILTTIQFNKGQIEMLKKVRSSNRNPIIYLPVHKSHLDYILISFVLYMNNVKPPLVAAGDNLSIPFFGNLLRGLGAFFIRRKLDPKEGHKDYVYRAVLEQYMAENLVSGESLEFFLEGGRSRSGKLVIPKTGLLSVIVNSVIENKIPDVSIVPVGVSYEKLIEGNFVNEQLGRGKENENFSMTSKAIWSTLKSNYGSVRVDFAQPFSLKEYLRGVSDSIYSGNIVNRLLDHELEENNVSKNVSKSSSCSPKKPCVACSAKAPGLRSIPSSASLYGLDLVDNEKRRLIQDLGEHVIFDAFQSSALMSTQLLSFLLLSKYRKGATMRQLVGSMNWLREEVMTKKKELGFTGESSDAIRSAYNLLGRDLVTTETIQMARSNSIVSNVSSVSGFSVRGGSDDDGRSTKKIVLLKPSNKLSNMLELQYYSNAVVSTFALDSIVANSIYALFDVGLDTLDDFETNNNSISRRELIENCLELCNLMKYEFILAPPCSDMEMVINDTIDGMIAKGIIKSNENPEKHRRGTFTFADDEDGLEDGVKGGGIVGGRNMNIQDSEQVSISLSTESMEQLNFYRSIISPLIESYWITATNLSSLLHTTCDYDSFVSSVIDSSKDHLRKGTLLYQESVAVEPLKNSIGLFENQNIIQRKIVNNISIVYLMEKFDSEKSINQVILNIEKFKK